MQTNYYSVWPAYWPRAPALQLRLAQVHPWNKTRGTNTCRRMDVYCVCVCVCVCVHARACTHVVFAAMPGCGLQWKHLLSLKVWSPPLSSFWKVWDSVAFTGKHPSS